LHGWKTQDWKTREHHQFGYQMAAQTVKNYKILIYITTTTHNANPNTNRNINPNTKPEA